MRIRRFLVVCCVCFFMAVSTVASCGAAYVLEPGDVLAVSVYGYSELSLKEVVIQPDGMIAVPLAGQVQTENLTASEFAAVLTERLERYLEQPLVTVNLLRRQPIKVSVLGEVYHPGYYSLERGGTLLDALSMASGWTKEAAKTKIMLFHKAQFMTLTTQGALQEAKVTQHDVNVSALPQPNSSEEQFAAVPPINLLDMLQKQDFRQNYTLKDGDVVYVSSNHRVDLIRDILPFVYPFYLLHHWEKEP
ncbi:MAG: polysaccharide biosynthesis/export family protein [Sporomusaceae bacterium]|nr:polysaccharide biosynthesis/export family protein [Sporomusaceae bacterium]